jgi:transcription antitermination factor NusG
MIRETSDERWFAVQVRTRWERSTAGLLESKGYQVLLPSGARKGRSAEAGSPLFPGYVFCRFDVLKRLPILITPGVMAVVGSGRVPVPIEPSEVEAIQALVSSGMPADPWPYLEVGQRVRIDSDALRGLEGILVSHKGVDRMVISVSLLRRSVALEIDRARINPVHSQEVGTADVKSNDAVLEEIIA